MKSQNRDYRYSRIAAAVLGLAAMNTLTFAADKQWVGGTGTWGVAGNWSPNGSPSIGDSASIGDVLFNFDEQVFLNTSVVLNNLKLDHGMILDSKGHAVQVAGSLTLAATFNNDSRILLRNGVNAFDLHVKDMILEGKSTLWMIDNPTTFVTGKMHVGSDASLFSGGVVNFTGDTGPVLVLDGSWAPNGVDSITFNQLGDGKIDLDGNSIADSTIHVSGRSGVGAGAVYDTFTVNGTGLHDDFDDAFEIGAGNTVNMNLSQGWTLTNNGRITFEFDPMTEPSVLNSTTLTVNGTIEFEDFAGSMLLNLAAINSAVIFNSSADVILGGHDTLDINGPATINGGRFLLTGTGHNELRFNGATTVNGGTFTEDSGFFGPRIDFNGATRFANTLYFGPRVVQNGTATVNSTTIINAGEFDMDGDDDAGTVWNINSGLTINADDLDEQDNEVSATININNSLFFPGSLTVNMEFNEAWTSKGTLNVEASGLGTSTVLAGSPVVLAGNTNVTKSAAFQNHVTFASGGTTTINADSAMVLNGGSIANANLIKGGRIIGPGKLRAVADRGLQGFGTIATAIDFDDNAQLLADNGTLRIEGPIEDVGAIGTASATGILSVGSSWNTSVAEQVQLNGGTITGLPMTNGGTTFGKGTITSTQFINNGTLSATALGTLTISSGFVPDLDGTTETGVVNAVSGSLHVTKQLADAFNGTLNIAENRTLNINGPFALASGGTINVSAANTANPAWIIATSQQVSGAINVGTATSLRMIAPTTFNAGASMSLLSSTSVIELAHDSTIAAGVTFDTPSSIPGSVEVSDTANLTLQNSAMIDARISNEGKVNIAGAAAGAVTMQRYNQTASAELESTIAGPVPSTQFDRLQVVESTTLDGNLALHVAGYNPAYLQPHEIVKSIGGVSGTFAGVTGYAVSPTKYMAVTYTSGSVLATAAIPGDANLDGGVNLDDFTALAANFGATGTWAKGSFDGNNSVNLDDFTLLAAHFGTSIPTDQPRPTAVPEPGGILAATALCLAAHRRRR